jgi:hypothetical protein
MPLQPYGWPGWLSLPFNLPPFGFPFFSSEPLSLPASVKETQDILLLEAQVMARPNCIRPEQPTLLPAPDGAGMNPQKMGNLAYRQ